MHVSRLLSRTLDQLRASLRGVESDAQPAARCVGRPSASASMLAGWSSPTSTTTATTASTTATPGRAAAAEAPGQPELDQLGEHDRAARPRRAAGQRPGAAASSTAPYAAKKTAVVTPIATRSGVEAGQLEHAVARASSSALDGHQRGGDDAAAPGGVGPGRTASRRRDA